MYSLLQLSASKLVLSADAEGAEPPIRYRWVHSRYGVLSSRINIEVARMRLDLLSEYNCEITSAIGMHPEPVLFARPVRVNRNAIVGSPRSAQDANRSQDLEELGMSVFVAFFVECSR